MKPTGFTKDNTLLFVDTNIFLNFYRTSPDRGLSLLEKLHGKRSLLITTAQVHMEFLKNRREILTRALENLKPATNDFQFPGFLSDAPLVKTVLKQQDEQADNIDKLRIRITEMLTDLRKDPVCCLVSDTIAPRSQLHLAQEDVKTSGIFDAAWTRFVTGNPPRKSDDQSIGDGINWEWILRCAEEHKKNVILATNDKDFGVKVEKEMHLNDWLAFEFNSRVPHRKILLLDRLANALKAIQVSVTEAEKEEEDIAAEAQLRGFYRIIVRFPEKFAEARIGDFVNRIQGLALYHGWQVFDEFSYRVSISSDQTLNEDEIRRISAAAGGDLTHFSFQGFQMLPSRQLSSLAKLQKTKPTK